MTADEQMLDAASMAAMTEFLRECEAPVDSRHHAAGNGDYNGLLPAGHSPSVAETVASWSIPHGGDADDGADSCEDNEAVQGSSPTSAERRRKIKNAQAGKRRLRYLKKLKAERKALKKQEVELSVELKKLRAAYKKDRVVREKKMLAISAWRATAIRQKEKRSESEEKQRLLKVAVINQSALVHRMNHLLVQQRLLQTVESSEDQAAHGSRKGKAVLKTFVREMDALYAKTDTMIANVDFEMSPPLTYELTRKWTKDKSFLESADATVIPYSFEQTCRAVSLMILAPSYNDELEDPENTAARTYRLNFSRELGDTQGDNATLVVYNAVRRYVEAGRAVFVWRTLAEGQGEFDGLHTVETAWFVVRPLSKDANPHANEGPKMILESYTRLVPVGFGSPSDNDARANRFVKILTKADEADVNDMKQMLGKLLLDEARATVDSCTGRRTSNS
ncbi:uncharacterized protein KRP23_6702 [Phytophthora ramorum]|uniref:uncharacterized protein n=1 Tax=Phytophthora ramorum TaxID=164328 RepID=UPI003099A028|nr:hypothetical protein KRP23_6702 [Phytophthora ramorum]